MKRNGLGRLIFGVLLVAVMLCALPLAAAAANDFVVSGDTTGYTYTNGVLTFTKGGDYTISMSGTAATTDQIKINAGSIYNSSKQLKLTLSGIKMERDGGYSSSDRSIEFTNTNSSNRIQVELVIDGENTITNKGYRGYCLYQDNNSASASIKVSGSGILTISNPNRDNPTSNVGDIFYADNFALDSENVQLVLNNVSIYAKNKIEINKGSLKIDQKLKTASRELHCLSADGEFIMSGGTLTANTSGTKSACIYVSDANTAGAGIKITGGTLDLTSYAYSRGALTLNLSTQNEATKALLIEGGTTSIYCTNKIGGTGIYLMGKNVVYTMAGGRLFIDSRGTGNTGITNYNGRGEVNIVFKGGETEIISNVALSSIKSVTFNENYIHKNYAGSSKEVTPDNNILNENGIVRKDYLLVTPAYKITYNVLEDCTIPNNLPTVYSKYDSEITITGTPTRPAYSFTGWTGSNGTTPQTTVTIPAGSTGDKEYTANWDGQEYKVYFYSNFEPGTYQTQTFKYGEEKALNENPFTREGYDFIGWNTVGQPTSDNPGTSYADKGNLLINTALDENQLKLWAQWRIRSHTISYTYSTPAPAGAPGVPASATVAYGSGQTVAAAPTLTGYTFSGWSGKTKTNGDTVAVDGNNAFTMPDDDVEFTGSWTANTYTVVFHANNGTTATSSQSFNYNEEKALTENAFTNGGYGFIGWNTVATPTSENPGVAYTDKQSVKNLTAENNGTIDLYGQWSVNQHTVSYAYSDPVPDGAPAVPASATVDYGTSQNVAAAPTLTGYTFSGWSGKTKTNGDTVAVDGNNAFTMPDDDVEFTGSWTANTYTVTVTGGTAKFERNGEKIEKAKAGDTVYIYADTGSIPEGKYCSAMVSDQVTLEKGWAPDEWFFEMPAENVTVTAEYKGQEEKTYDLTDAENHPDVEWDVINQINSYPNSQYQVLHPDDTALPFEYDFNNDSNADVAIDRNTNKATRGAGADALTDDPELTFSGLRFSPIKFLLLKKYTVTVTNGTGSGDYVKGESVTITASAPEGKRFQEWTGVDGLTFTTGSGATESAVFVMPPRNVDVSAAFETSKYTIQFVNEDGGVLQSGEVEHGAMPVYTEETPHKAEDEQYTYTFAGWTPEITAATGAAVYTASYTPVRRSYPITWQMDDDSVIDTVLVEYGTMPAHDAPVKESDADYIYTFSKWTPDPVSVSGPATYKAQFTATAKTEYTVIWLNGDGTELDRKTYKEGAEEPATDKTPVKAEDAENTYTFSGWDSGKVEGNVKTYAPRFTATAKKVYTVILSSDGNGAASADPASGTEGTGVTLTATPKEGYRFKEWQVITGGVTITDNKFSIERENVELKAIFELAAPKEYAFTKGNGSSWTKGSGTPLDFTVKGSPDDTATFQNFTGIDVDGKAVAGWNYTTAPGSVNISLIPGYLEDMTLGIHKITANFTDGSAVASFTVNYKVPKTGDEGNPMLWLGCVLAGSVMIAVFVYAEKRKKTVSK